LGALKDIIGYRSRVFRGPGRIYKALVDQDLIKILLPSQVVVDSCAIYPHNVSKRCDIFQQFQAGISVLFEKAATCFALYSAASLKKGQEVVWPLTS